MALERRAGALERAGHRFLAGVQDPGRLAGMEPQHIAQDDGGPPARRQQLQGGDEGERDRFPGLIPGLRAGCAVSEPRQQVVRVGLEPGQLTEPGRLRRLQPGRRRGHRRAPAGRAQRVQAPARGDPVQPGPHRGASLEPGQVLPGRQQGVLQRVLRVGHRAEKPVAIHLQLTPVRIDKLSERVLVAGLCPGEQFRRHRAPLPVAASGSAPAGQYRRRRGPELGARQPPSLPGRPPSRSAVIPQIR